MKKPLICLGFAIAAAGCTGDNDTSAQQAAEMQKMLDQPTGTYALIPHTRTKDNKDVYTGRFDLLVKKNDFTTAQAFDKQGHQGTQLCANFDLYGTQINSDGKMGLPYRKWYSGNRGSGSYTYIYEGLKDMKPETLLSPPAKMEYEQYGVFNLAVETRQACRFTPKAP